MSERHAFTIQIGDWSDDGHGKCDDYTATAAKPIEATREAFFAAKKKHPKVCPTTFCDKYEDGVVPPDVAGKIAKMGGPTIGKKFGTEEMAAIVVWFLNLGDPDLDARLDPKSATPTLAFYGYDKRKRHIDGIGYGLFYG